MALLLFFGKPSVGIFPRGVRKKLNIIIIIIIIIQRYEVTLTFDLSTRIGWCQLHAQEAMPTVQGGKLSSLAERLRGETTAVQRTVVWYRAMVINLVCGFVSAVCLGFSFYGTVRLSLYLDTVARAGAAGSLMHGLTGLTVASFVVSMVGIYVSYALYGRYGELGGGELRPFALAYVACAACVAVTVGAAFFVVCALLLPHIAQTRVRRLMRWLQLRFDFDTTSVRLPIKGHQVHNDVTWVSDLLDAVTLTYLFI